VQPPRHKKLKVILEKLQSQSHRLKKLLKKMTTVIYQMRLRVRRSQVDKGRQRLSKLKVASKLSNNSNQLRTVKLMQNRNLLNKSNLFSNNRIMSEAFSRHCVVHFNNKHQHRPPKCILQKIQTKRLSYLLYNKVSLRTGRTISDSKSEFLHLQISSCSKTTKSLCRKL